MEDLENLETNDQQSPQGDSGTFMDTLEIGLQALSSTPADLQTTAELNALPGELGEIGSALLESGGHAIGHLAEGIGEAVGAIAEAIGETLSGL
ncbi:MAG: hypothetical protein RLZZ511_153 [Cyanobacteriota bacterium]|jgi:hypothetical protein